ncbi:MAG: hypothetical protein K1X89_27345 [Myxococcaceae bacterium]|nr:hypothetical protein [Myxococcaceae bacterium]
MTLHRALGKAMAEKDASSHQLSGEALWLLTGADLRRAADEYQAQLSALPPKVRARVEEEHERFAPLAHRWLERFNRSLETRLQGYAAMGSLLAWEYPWPVVAILGVLVVRDGMRRTEALRLIGSAVQPVMEVGDWMQDVLRRTNRGIFGDSIPTTLFAVRCHHLRLSGEAEVAQALLDGPLPPAMDEESRALMRGLYDALGLVEGEARFRALAELTFRHFDREQSVFTAQMGAKRSEVTAPPSSFLASQLTKLPFVDAPRIVKGKLRFGTYKLGFDFNVRDHAQRCERFGAAFVRAVTGTSDDYRAATAYVTERFGPSAPPHFAPGVARLPPWSRAEELVR